MFVRPLYEAESSFRRPSQVNPRNVTLRQGGDDDDDDEDDDDDDGGKVLRLAALFGIQA